MNTETHYDDFGWHTTDPSFSHRVASEPCPTTPPAEDSGWNWTGFAWVELRIPTPPVDPTPVQVARYITPLAFRRRFTKAERAAVEWAAVDKPDRPEAERQMAAALRADLKDQEQAKFIDLDDPELVEGVATLEAFGLIAAGRAEEILSAPVQPGERA